MMKLITLVSLSGGMGLCVNYLKKTATNYYELVDLLRSRRVSLGVSQLEIDEIAGLQTGYTGKLEKPQSSYGRHARWDTLEWWLGALNVGIQVVPLHPKRKASRTETGLRQNFQLELPLPFDPPQYRGDQHSGCECPINVENAETAMR